MQEREGTRERLGAKEKTYKKEIRCEREKVQERD